MLGVKRGLNVGTQRYLHIGAQTGLPNRVMQRALSARENGGCEEQSCVGEMRDSCTRLHGCSGIHRVVSTRKCMKGVQRGL